MPGQTLRKRQLTIAIAVIEFVFIYCLITTFDWEVLSLLFALLWCHKITFGIKLLPGGFMSYINKVASKTSYISQSLSVFF